jgi:predicted AAA+ superfamily ATPase
LVGRVSILRLYPFSLKEFIRAKKIKSLSDKIKSRTIWEHIIYGGYPKVVLTEEKEMKEIILRDLFETMLLKDISRNFSIEDLNTLEKLTKYLALNVGNIVSYENLTNLFNLSFKTLKKYLDAVEKSYLIKRVTPFYTNKSRELSKRPKIYFMDLGLRNFISKEFEVQGKNFENYVFTELLKLGFLPKYWRTKEKAEVDFIIEKGNELIPIEVKISSEKVSRSLKSFIKIYKPKKAFVIFYKGRKKEKEIENCKVIFTDIFGLNKLLTS